MNFTPWGGGGGVSIIPVLCTENYHSVCNIEDPGGIFGKI